MKKKSRKILDINNLNIKYHKILMFLENHPFCKEICEIDDETLTLQVLNDS